MTLFPETQSTLLLAIQTPEDREAWEEFVVLYRPVIYRMARRRGMQDADAQDLSQQVMVRIAGAIGRYESQSGTKFRHWLRRVANNAICTAIARPARDAGAGGSVAMDLFSELPAIDSHITEELNKECERELYLRAAAVVRSDVNAETWSAFEMTMTEGMSCEAAAKALGKSVGTVYAARSRVVKRLRIQIERIEKRI